MLAVEGGFAMAALNNSYAAQMHALTPGALGPYLDEFASELACKGYAPLTISGYAASIAHFGGWLERHRIAVEAIDDQCIKAFAAHRCRCPGARQHRSVSRKYVARVALFIGYLRQRGILNQIEDPVRPEPPAALGEFCSWLLHHRGLSPRTIDRHNRLISKLLPALRTDTTRWDAAIVRDVITAEVKRNKIPNAKCVISALRMYLRFLASVNLCRPGLDLAVPTVAQWRLSALPRYLVEDDIERIVNSCDLETDTGVRDHAILLLLARLGLRGGDIVNLRLDDIDWRSGQIQIRGKSRREVRLPLPQDAGDALLEYLVRVRPSTPVGQVFLCMNAPWRPFATSATVCSIVGFALCRAGIWKPPSKGANLLRHSVATSMLRGGATLDAIGTVLRHRSSQTTAHYAKVDVVKLRGIAQPWPGGVSC
ncbi:tyrosine-type recombinase/integrase [Paraburkholderia sp. RCC_158]|uniref:tyrosine-type recombinase/integrase n=1 Tax=Paraburkholderia sp. RCC_158 TaxID=3239220 RepID=UPI003523454E